VSPVYIFDAASDKRALFPRDPGATVDPPGPPRHGEPYTNSKKYDYTSSHKDDVADAVLTVSPAKFEGGSW